MEETIINQGNESIKLIKNSKGYFWEIKIFINSGDEPNKDEEALVRLNKLDEELLERFKNEKEGGE